ncbi:MAG: CPBP family intramembrane metalloprotease [Coriobacteriia bacterium]|nr:CPBP family intramembrane metalloprotease [Coriobacteriia bacterium]MCL2745568.1 CPBP family intramembrane metalloprotease [Coriobacteriia bacterium]MCL2870586.1 CPBP family intramembrane metalloprotease [Coriobacteriia bacterium]
MGRRSARTTAKQVQRRPQPRKRISLTRPWGWVDVAWVTIALLVASVFTIFTLGHQFTALMPDEGVVGVRIALLMIFYLLLLMILAYRAHTRNLGFLEAYRLKRLSRAELRGQQAFPYSQKALAEEGTLDAGNRSEEPQFMPAWKSALLVVAFFFALRTFALVYTYVTAELGWVTPPAASLTDLFSPTFFGLIAAVISIVILAPFIEELVFRVIIFDTLAQKVSIAAAVVLQGLIFSFYHFSLWAAVPNFLLALACVYLVQKCRTALPAILLHVLYNAAVVAAAFYLAMT